MLLLGLDLGMLCLAGCVLLWQDIEKAFQREMGGAAVEERLTRFMVGNTNEHAEILDPVDRLDIHPSHAYIRKGSHFLLSTALASPQQLYPDTRQERINKPGAVESRHAYDGSWVEDKGRCRHFGAGKKAGMVCSVGSAWLFGTVQRQAAQLRRSLL